jgi:hypothetical protein
LVNSFIHDVGIKRPLTQDAHLLCNPKTDVASGPSLESLVPQVQDYLCGHADRVEGLMNEAGGSFCANFVEKHSNF